MLTIRLSRHGRKKLPFYRVVLTDHTKPVKSWYKEVLWSYDPMKHILEVQVDVIKAWIAKWAKLSERVAKLIYQQTKEDFFKQCFVERTRTAKTKKEEKK
jgi:small subunit ribosomal protein S16